MVEVRFAGVADLGSMLARRRIGAVELATITLDLLHRDGRDLNAVAALTAERAMSEAANADRLLAQAGTGSGLLGMPYGAKDLFAASGAPTTWGAEPYAEQLLHTDAAAIRRLAHAGGVLVAKLASIALGGAGGNRYPSASLQGPTHNPWDRSRWSGGSSSGPAAAVAAGLLPYALATETTGSIGTPAAFCGITGLRPTYGAVDRRGVMALSWTLDKVGVLARSAADCASVFTVLASSRVGRAPADGARPRLGVLREELERHASVEIRETLAQGLREIEGLARRIVPVALPGLPYRAMVETIYNAEAAAAFSDLIADGRIDQLTDPKQKAGLRAALDIRACDYLHAQRLRTSLAAEFRSIFDEVEFLVSFGRATTATGISEARDGPRGWNAGLVPAGNLAGLPAVFFPCGLAADGLPAGLQVVGPPGSEDRLLSFVDSYQRTTGHHLRRPN